MPTRTESMRKSSTNSCRPSVALITGGGERRYGGVRGDLGFTNGFWRIGSPITSSTLYMGGHDLESMRIPLLGKPTVDVEDKVAVDKDDDDPNVEDGDNDTFSGFTVGRTRKATVILAAAREIESQDNKVFCRSMMKRSVDWKEFSGYFFLFFFFLFFKDSNPILAYKVARV